MTRSSACTGCSSSRPAPPRRSTSRRILAAVARPSSTTTSMARPASPRWRRCSGASSAFSSATIIAWQLAFPALNFDLPWTNFGRLRPLHTSAVIFAFGGNVLLATSLYVVQRTCRARLAGYWSAWFVVWGYQLFIVLAAHRLRHGRHPGQGVRRARMVHRPVADDRLGHVPARLPRHAGEAQRAAHLRRQLVLSRLHRDRSRCCTSSTIWRCPVSFLGSKSYSLFSGVQDAMTQWWYGHNAVGFFLTAGFLGIMYYFIPKRVERPVYSYRLSIIHFWTPDLPLHLGRPAPPALHGAARLGADARHDVLDHAVDAVVGRHDQRPDDAVRRLGPAAHRSGRAAARRLGRLLRHVDLRRAADVASRRSTRCRTTPTGRSATCTRARWAGSAWSRSARSTAWCRGCGSAKASTRCASSSGTSGSRRSASCSTSPRCGCRASCRA